MSNFLQTVNERVVIYDGAMGTSIQTRNPSVDDFWGKEGCNELLVLSRYQNLKYEEIAGILGCDVGAVKVRVYRAVRALGQIYFELAGEKAS